MAWQLGILTIEQLYVVGFVTGVLTVFFDVSYQAYLPSLLERDEYLEGNSKLEISRTVAQTAGPAMGGGLIGFIGAPIAIVADAISFLASAAFVSRIRRREPAPDPHLDAHGEARVGIRREVADGLRYVLGSRYLRTIAASTGLSNLFSNIAFATYLVYAVRNLGLDPGTIGVVLGIGNLGAIIGAFTATRLGRRWRGSSDRGLDVPGWAGSPAGAPGVTRGRPSRSCWWPRRSSASRRWSTTSTRCRCGSRSRPNGCRVG